MSDQYYRLDDVVDLVHGGIEMEKAEELLGPWIASEFGRRRLGPCPSYRWRGRSRPGQAARAGADADTSDGGRVMTLPAQLSPRVAALLKKTQAARGRLIFALDATASREGMWDLAASLQAQMFEETAKVGGLDVQLVHYRGHDEMRPSPWLTDARALIDLMRTIRCASGATQITRVLEHISTENAREKISAAIFIGDAVEEHPDELYAVANIINVPIFLFQEGDGYVMSPVSSFSHPLVPHFDPPRRKVEAVFRRIAQLTGGAYGKFDAGAARQLGELLRAVAAFAVGGTAALANQKTDSARLLLGQIKS